MSRNGRPGRCRQSRTKGRSEHWARGVALVALVSQHRHPFWPLFYSLSTPVLAHSLLPNSIMPAHRHSSTARPHAAGRPYKASIIVISSDEDEEPLSVPKRGSRKPRRSRVEGEILEILDETPVKAEEPDLECLRQRCHELEQACSLHCSMNPPYKRNPSGLNLLGARYAEER